MSNAKVLSSHAIASGSVETVPLAASENKDDLSTLFKVSITFKVMVLLYLVSCFSSSSSIEKMREKRDDPHSNFQLLAEPIRDTQFSSRRGGRAQAPKLRHTASGE
jgi:hypothetical protein